MKRSTKLQITALGLAALMVGGCQQGSENSIVENAPAGGQSATTSVAKDGWYMRTIVSAKSEDGTTYLHNTAGVFGELSDSLDGRDRHDIPSYGKATLQVRFVNSNIAEGEEFFSDYRAYEAAPRKEVWTFVVKNETGADLSNASLQIEVNDMIDVFKRANGGKYVEKKAADQDRRSSLVLVDVDNHQAYNYDALANVSLSMDGKKVRTFRWVLNGSVDESDYEPLAQAAVTIVPQTQAYKASNLSEDKFGLPPE